MNPRFSAVQPGGYQRDTLVTGLRVHVRQPLRAWTDPFMSLKHGLSKYDWLKAASAPGDRSVAYWRYLASW